MSTTAYQTNAKPRGRRGSYGEKPGKEESRSRASSSASTRLSKTLSRTLDRQPSPAMYLRHRGIDSSMRHFEQSGAPAKPPSSWLRSERRSDEKVAPTDPSAPIKNQTFYKVGDDGKVAPSLMRKRTEPSVESYLVGGDSSIVNTTPPQRAKTVDLGPPYDAQRQSAPTGETNRDREPVLSSESPFRRVQSARTLSSMQPTVADESTESLQRTMSHPQKPQSSSMSTKESEISSPSVPTPSTSASKAVDEQPSPKSTFALPKDSTESISPIISKSILADPVTSNPPSPPKPTPVQPSSVPTPQPLPPGAFMPNGTTVPFNPSFGNYAQTPFPPFPFDHAPPPESLRSFSPPVDPEKRMSGQFQQQSSSTPLTSPPLSPILHHYQSPPMPPYAYPYPPHMLQQPPYHPLNYYPPPFSPPIPAAPFESRVRSASGSREPPHEDERAALLSKVSNALPDFSRLLALYSSSLGELSFKDTLLHSSENSYSESLATMRVEFDAAKEEYERIIAEMAGENERLKTEAQGYKERMSPLEEINGKWAQIREDAKKKDGELSGKEEEVKDLRDRLGKAESGLKLTEEDREALKQQLAEQESDHTSAIATLKAEHEKKVAEMKENHGAELAEIEAENRKSAIEAKKNLSKIQLDLAGLLTKYAVQAKELDSTRSLLSDHEASLATKKGELSRALATAQRHEMALASKTTELASAVERHKSEVEGMATRAINTAKMHDNAMAAKQKELAEVKVAYTNNFQSIKVACEQDMAKARELAETKLGAQLKGHHARETALLAELAGLQASLESARSDRSRESEEHSKSRVELQRLRSQHEAEKAEHSRVREALARERARHENLRGETAKAREHHVELVEVMRLMNQKQVAWRQEVERMEHILQRFGDGHSGETGSEWNKAS